MTRRGPPLIGFGSNPTDLLTGVSGGRAMDRWWEGLAEELQRDVESWQGIFPPGRAPGHGRPLRGH
ncbi:hypothetical protein IBTHAUMO2_260048 [Nitrosopumilaceae archaeon]|nr:hypothetical protein IBTHAUMO2_260048 [Nitrosopumilaceae archaeon]